MKVTFDHTVSVLVSAYLNDELKHQVCSCCAVGNIISHACGYKSEAVGDKIYWTRDDEVYDPQKWSNVFGTKNQTQAIGLIQQIFGLKQKRVISNWFEQDNISPTVKSWAKSTGYSVVQLARIEYAFEAADYGHNEDTWMFNGLMAVVDVLAEIHNVDLSIREQAKALFVKGSFTENM